MTHGYGVIPLGEGWRFIKDDDPGTVGLLDQASMSDILDRADRGDCSGALRFAWAQPDFDDFRQPVRKAFHGWAQAIVRAIPGASGTICVKALSKGLESVSLQINACGA